MVSAELNAKSEARTIQRIEVLTGPERRRRWSEEDKERIVGESYSGTDSVSRVARRHGLLPSQLFTWRREVREAATPPAFAAVTLARVARPKTGQPGLPTRAKPRGSGIAKTKMASEVAIEISAGGITVRVRRGADSSLVTAIVRALKATS